MTSTLRTFVSLTPLLQGPTFIAAGAGPAGQGAGCPTGIHCQSSMCSFRVGPTDSRILLPSTVLRAASPLQRCVLAPEAARSLQGSLGRRTGKGGFSPGSTWTVLQQLWLTLTAVACALGTDWCTENHHPRERGAQLVPAKQGEENTYLLVLG